jgi:CHASE3 domain sensor protein
VKVWFDSVYSEAGAAHRKRVYDALEAARADYQEAKAVLDAADKAAGDLPKVEEEYAKTRQRLAEMNSGKLPHTAEELDAAIKDNAAASKAVREAKAKVAGRHEEGIRASEAFHRLQSADAAYRALPEEQDAYATQAAAIQQLLDNPPPTVRTGRPAARP